MSKTHAGYYILWALLKASLLENFPLHSLILPTDKTDRGVTEWEVPFQYPPLHRGLFRGQNQLRLPLPRPLRKKGDADEVDIRLGSKRRHAVHTATIRRGRIVQYSRPHQRQCVRRGNALSVSRAGERNVANCERTEDHAQRGRSFAGTDGYRGEGEEERDEVFSGECARKRSEPASAASGQQRHEVHQGEREAASRDALADFISLRSLVLIRIHRFEFVAIVGRWCLATHSPIRARCVRWCLATHSPIRARCALTVLTPLAVWRRATHSP